VNTTALLRFEWQRGVEGKSVPVKKKKIKRKQFNEVKKKGKRKTFTNQNIKEV